LLPPRGQRDQPTVSLSRQIADQCVEPRRQISNGINRTVITTDAIAIAPNELGISLDFTACTAAGRIQHLHTINSKQSL